MPYPILTFLDGAFVLVFGISLSVAFSGVQLTKRNLYISLSFFLLCGILQTLFALLTSADVVRKLYPLIAHLPVILWLHFYYRKSFETAMAATFTSYLFCQPAKWIGILVHQLTNSHIAEFFARTICLFLVCYFALFHIRGCLSAIFNKDRRSVHIFGIVPMVFYLFDYITAVYTNLWVNSNRVVMEFLPFFLVVVYMIFCYVYYQEYEQKAEALQKEKIIRISLNQQAKEMKAIKQSEQEIRLLRHDMRLFLSSLVISLENNETDKAKELITTYISTIENTRLERFCQNDTVNYVFSDYAARCKAAGIPFTCVIEMDELSVDEFSFSSILSNALDNALNAQKQIPASKRSIRVMLKHSNGKLLLSVKNPVEKKVTFVDGLPVSDQTGHGYGSQSIRYMTERLGGNCQFSVQDDTFILRVIL